MSSNEDFLVGKTPAATPFFSPMQPPARPRFFSAPPLELPPALESRRAEFEAILEAAGRRLERFAAGFGWGEHLQKPFADSAAIFDSRAAFQAEMARVFGLSPTEAEALPKTFSGFLHDRRLATVSPGLYQENYPDGDEPGAFEKLLTHEYAHHLHIRILGGDEEAMGPIWFFEGFALVAAGQFEGRDLTLSPEDMRRILAESERGSYREYAALTRHLLKSATLPEMVQRAREGDFGTWVSQRANG
jgi:hypothetical protein